jgi:hypothetical protein
MTEDDIILKTASEIRKFITRGHSREDVLIEMAFKYAPSYSEQVHGCSVLADFDVVQQNYSKCVFLTAVDLWRLQG